MLLRRKVVSLSYVRYLIMMLCNLKIFDISYTIVYFLMTIIKWRGCRHYIIVVGVCGKSKLLSEMQEAQSISRWFNSKRLMLLVAVYTSRNIVWVCMLSKSHYCLLLSPYVWILPWMMAKLRYCLLHFLWVDFVLPIAQAYEHFHVFAHFPGLGLFLVLNIIQ